MVHTGNLYKERGEEGTEIQINPRSSCLASRFLVACTQRLWLDRDHLIMYVFKQVVDTEDFIRHDGIPTVLPIVDQFIH